MSILIAALALPYRIAVKIVSGETSMPFKINVLIETGPLFCSASGNKAQPSCWRTFMSSGGSRLLSRRSSCSDPCSFIVSS